MGRQKSQERALPLVESASMALGAHWRMQQYSCRQRGGYLRNAWLRGTHLLLEVLVLRRAQRRPSWRRTLVIILARHV